MKIFDRLKQKIGLGASVDEVVQAAEGEEWDLPNTRHYRRAVMRSQRLKGAGYTRSFRKGRTQRGSTTNHPAEPGEGSAQS